MSYVLKRTADKKFLFNLKARNGEVILTSEAYEQKASAENGIRSVRLHGVLDSCFEIWLSPLRQQYFVLKASNGQVLGTSEMYTSHSGVETGIAAVKTNCQSQSVDDQT